MPRTYLVLGRLLEAMQRTNSMRGTASARKASVAAIFRLAHPHAYVFPHIPPAVPVKSVPELIEYFQRAYHRWIAIAGKLPFQGGKRKLGRQTTSVLSERLGEKLVREEIGLHLDNHKDFAYMGRLNEIFLPQRLTRKGLTLTTHGISYTVFVQLSPVTPSLTLCKREVGSYRWVDFRTFTHEFQNRFQPLEQDIPGPALGPWSRAVNLLSKGKLTIRYAGIDLPPANSQACDGLGDRPDSSQKYLLWGITFWRLRALVRCLGKADKTNAEKDWSFYTCGRPWQFLAPAMRCVDLILGPEKVNPTWVLGTALVFGAVGVSVGLAAGVSYVA